MPDPITMLEAMAAAAFAAAAVALAGGWLARGKASRWPTAGSILGIALGFVIGCWLLGIRPHWPPREDQDRLLLLLLPAAALVELTIAGLELRQRWAWSLRLIIAAGAAPLLLYNSIYLADLAGPGSREWTTSAAWTYLGALAASLAGVWLAMTLLARRTQSRSLPLALAATLGGAAVTVMLSGYASGGQVGLPLAAALAGAVCASLVFTASSNEGIVGIGFVGLFGLLIIGRFFGDLTTTHAAILLFGPLLCWLAETPFFLRMKAGWRGLLRIGLAAAPVAVVLYLAQQQFMDRSTATSTEAPEATVEDYLNFK